MGKYQAMSFVRSTSQGTETWVSIVFKHNLK